MVSFFGLKLGGDKKKRGEKAAESTKEIKPIDRNALGEGQFFGTSLNKSALLEHPGSIPRPDTAASNRSMGGLRRPKVPYAWAGASSSMVDLSASPAAQFHATKPSAGGNSLRHVGGSEANLRMRWNNGSSTSLVPPNKAIFGAASTPSGPDGRPGTAGSQRTKAWVNPLDVHFGRDGTYPTASRPSTSNGTDPPPAVCTSPTGAPQLPKSPLGTFEFNLPPFDASKKPETGLKEGKRDEMTPSPLYQVRSRSPPSPKSYPSPPQSVKDLEPPRMRVDTSLRSSSRQRDGSVEQDSMNPTRGGGQGPPGSLPSPAASVPRSSDEKPWSGPVIQNVRAKRETLTINGPRRQSFSMDVEEANRQAPEATRPEPVRRPGTAGNGSPPPRSTRRPRPPPNDHFEGPNGQNGYRPSPPPEHHEHHDAGQWRPKPVPREFAAHTGNPYERNRETSPPEHYDSRQWGPKPVAQEYGRNPYGQPRETSPPEHDDFDFDQWRPRPAPQEYAAHTGNPCGQTQETSQPRHDDSSQWRHRGPSPFEERENRFQAPARPFQQSSHPLRDSSPYRRGPRQPDYQEGDMRPYEHSRPPPQMGQPGPRGREPHRQDRGDVMQGPRSRPPQGRPDEFSPPNRPAQQGPSPAPRPPPEGQYRIAARPPRDEPDVRPLRPRREAPETAYLSPVSNPDPELSWEPSSKQKPIQHADQQPTQQAVQQPAQNLAPQPAADPNHPSKGPQDFNIRPGFGQSSAKRRPPPPRLNPAPPPLRLRRDVDSPAFAESPALPPADRKNIPVNPITSAKFNEPRQAPSPPSTAATSFQLPSSPPQAQLQPPPPLLESLASLENPRKPPSPTKQASAMASRTPDLSSNPNWPLVDSGPPSAAFTVQSPEGASSYGGSKPTSPAGMPLASPAFGTFAIGSNSPGPSHWAPNPPAWADDKRAVERTREPPRDRLGGASTPVRPDFGLRAPTGIADKFQVKFI